MIGKAICRISPDHERGKLRSEILYAKIDSIERLLRPQAQFSKADDKRPTPQGVTRSIGIGLATNTHTVPEEEIKVIVRHLEEIFDRSSTNSHHVL